MVISGSTFALFELMEQLGVGLGRTDCKLCPCVPGFEVFDRAQSSVNSQFHVYLPLVKNVQTYMFVMSNPRVNSINRRNDTTLVLQ